MTVGSVRSSGLGSGAPSNPFAIPCVEPGAIPFLVDGGEASAAWLDEMLDAARSHGGGQVRGPHGAGKTTLLRHLHRRAEARGWAVAWCRAPEPATVEHGGVAFIDSASAWPFWRWPIVRRRMARVGVIPIVTTHRNLGLHPLHTRSVSPAMAARIVDHLAPGLSVPEGKLGRMLDAHRGSLRGVLFDLYDEWERSHVSVET